MEKSIAEDLLEENPGGSFQNFLGINTRSDQGIALVYGNAADPFQCQYPL